jgi:DNA-binding NarL/FixJ family response regulator
VEKISRCERRVMSLLLQGKSNNEISQMLNRSPKTISVLKQMLFSKLNITSLAELVLLMSARLLNSQRSRTVLATLGLCNKLIRRGIIGTVFAR